MTEQLLQLAREHHRAGRLHDALQAYRTLTDSQPEAAEHWRLRAMAEHQTGDLAQARSSIARAIELEPAQPAAHLVAAHIDEDLGDNDAAEASFRRATELKPDWAPAWNGLGTRLLEKRRSREALAAFQKALDADPTMVRAWNNLGMAFTALERFDEAMRAYNHALALNPRYALPHMNLARLHEMRGDKPQALQSVQAAVQLDPGFFDARMFLGDALRRQTDVEGAQQSYAAAAALRPGDPQAPVAIADLLWESGFVERSREAFAAVERIHSGCFRAALGSRLILPAVYDSAAHLEECRARYLAGLDELLDMSGRFRWAQPKDALRDSRWTNFYLAYQGREDREPQAKFGELMHRVLGANAPAWMEPPAPRAPDGRIRIGFFSYFFFNSTVGRYFASWIHGLDRERFDIRVYYTNAWIGDDTREIAASASRFRHLAGRPIDYLVDEVRADQLDILVYPELGMNIESFALGSLRLAPIQVTGWGHPTTTGLPNIDWFLSSAEMEPADAQRSYTERLALLPGMGTRYELPRGEEQGSRADFGLPDGKRLYLVPQSTFKVHPDNDELIARVLARDPDGIAVMFAANHAQVTNTFVARLAPHFRKHGLEVRDRVVFLPYMTHGAYLRLNRLCDVMLDTVHWSGGNTSLDALAMGLPVVTLPGHLMRGRQSLGMLNMMGIPELVAHDADEYVELAAAIAGDRDRREDISRRIVASHGRLFGRDEPVAAFRDFIERAVREGPRRS
ncbi:MAG TPA: tetratricopeptide repeat protein [Usitatibacter sp.]|nr:tetratricopeptide repeat protein [Usitatibacter sp.]